MKKQRRSLWIVLCGVVASLGLMLGVWSNGLVRADAAATPPTLTMDAGASVRKTAGDPGLKFKATIEGWNGAYNYGMLILPAQAWDTYGWWGKNVDYVNFLLGENLTAGKDFIQVDCPVYKDDNGNSKIALAITDLNDYNYAKSVALRTKFVEGTNAYFTGVCKSRGRNRYGKLLYGRGYGLRRRNDGCPCGIRDEIYLQRER